MRTLQEALAVAGPRCTGTVTGTLGLTVDVVGVSAGIGELVRIEGPDREISAEVVAVGGSELPRLTCMPLGATTGLRAGLRVRATGASLTVPVGEDLRGRILNGLGRPLDDGPSLRHLPHVPIDVEAPHPLHRQRVDRPLSVGVRALDTLVPFGRGQRVGIFAGSGVGKSSLLSMITRNTEAEVSVICLVGERGREVREFIENDLSPEGLARSVVVIATSDTPPMVRLRAPFVATRIAEYLRDQGQDVVLLMDSLTRLAYAQREVGLSAGEPPATRGYPPSVFALLPRLLERAGPAAVGSITGVYTVLVDGDDHNEPIGDCARSILDGHITLTRRLATAGHFPSIDVLESVSRVNGAVTTPEQRATASQLRRLLAAQRDARELIEIGAYVPGTNPTVDLAQQLAGPIEDFLRQDLDEGTPAAESWSRLEALLGGAA